MNATTSPRLGLAAGPQRDCVWLVYARPPHPLAVCHPAREDEVHLVLELLAACPAQRQAWAERLRQLLAEQDRWPPWQRAAVPCRRASGLYVLIPWRLAAWLAVVLPASEGVRERLALQLRHWLATRQTSLVKAC